MGLSLLEISHRSKEFVAVNDEARALIKELLDVPAGYEVVFMGGGASMQFCMVPYNLLNKKASYLDTGTWASNAIKEAKLFGEVDVVASSKDKNYTYIPKVMRSLMTRIISILLLIIRFTEQRCVRIRM